MKQGRRKRGRWVRRKREELRRYGAKEDWSEVRARGGDVRFLGRGDVARNAGSDAGGFRAGASRRAWQSDPISCWPLQCSRLAGGSGPLPARNRVARGADFARGRGALGADFARERGARATLRGADFARGRGAQGAGQRRRALTSNPRPCSGPLPASSGPSRTQEGLPEFPHLRLGVSRLCASLAMRESAPEGKSRPASCRRCCEEPAATSDRRAAGVPSARRRSPRSGRESCGCRGAGACPQEQAPRSFGPERARRSGAVRQKQERHGTLFWKARGPPGQLSPESLEQACGRLLEF